MPPDIAKRSLGIKPPPGEHHGPRENDDCIDSPNTSHALGTSPFEERRQQVSGQSHGNRALVRLVGLSLSGDPRQHGLPVLKGAERLIPGFWGQVPNLPHKPVH